MDQQGIPWPLQMTIAENRDLKNSSALNTIEYFDKMLGKSKADKYAAVCVVPKKAAVKSKNRISKVL